MKLNLFIDAVSVNGIIFLFNEKRKILVKKNLSVSWNENKFLLSSSLLEYKKNKTFNWQ